MSGGHASVTTRISAFSAVTVAAFLVLIGQLWYLQILEGPRLRELSEQNRNWKTGTAQAIHDSDATKGQDHAWFAGFAPADDPRVVVVVLVERGGMGGKVAAPLARHVFEAIFSRAAALDDGGA